MAAQAGVEVPEKVHKDTRAVLLSSIKGVPLRQFCKDYWALVHEPFPWRTLGFKSPVELLLAMPNSVRFEFSEKDKDYRLYGIGSGHCFMPSWFVKAQGNPARSYTPHHVDLPSPTCSEPMPSTFGFNSGGLVTVYVSWKTMGSPMNQSPRLSEKEIQAKEVMLQQMMRKAGNPVEIYVHPSGYSFVRFRSLQEAHKAFKLYNKVSYHGLRFVIKPATEGNTTNRQKRTGWKGRSRGSDRAATRMQPGKIGPPIRTEHDRTPGTDRMSHDQRQLSRDSGRWSCDLSQNPSDLPRSRCVQPARSEDESSSSSQSGVEMWASFSDSSLEWDDTLLDDHIAVQLNAVSTPCQNLTVPVPYQNASYTSSSPPSVQDPSLQLKFPGIDNETLKTILSSSRGAKSWYERFASVCGSARVVVTEVVSACHFWAQIDDEAGNQATIEKCLKFLEPSEEEVERGSVCAAFLQREGAWKRCWYDGPMGTAVGRVFLLDEGRWEHIPLENLTSLPPFVANLPMLALPCVLSGLQLDSWSPESLQNGARCLRRLVGGLPLSATLMLRKREKSLDPIPVILDHESAESNTNINSAMLTTGLVTQSSQPSNETASLVSEVGHMRGRPMRVPVNERLLQRMDGSQSPWRSNHAVGVATNPAGLSGFCAPNECGLTPVTVREVASPDLIWLQMSCDPERDLDKISKKIEELRPKRAAEVQLGSVVSLKVREQLQYRRSQVKLIKEYGQATVVWIDTGRTHSVTMQQLYQLPPEVAITTLPPLAIPCRLHGVISTLGTRQEWNPLDNQLLWKHLFGVKVYARFMKSPFNSSLPHSYVQGSRLGAVELYFDSEGYESVAEAVVREGYNIDFERNNPCTSTDIGHKRSSRPCGAEATHESSLTRQSISPWKKLQNSLLSDSAK